MLSIHTYIPQLSPLYCEPHRNYHSLTHIHSLVRLINADATKLVDTKRLGNDCFDMVTYNDRTSSTSLDNFLLYVAWFHDSIYDPYAAPRANEMDSCKLFHSLLLEGSNKRSPEDENFIIDVSTTIVCTANHSQSFNFDGMEPDSVSAASLLFLDLDLYGFSVTEQMDISDRAIRAEYYNTNDTDYLKGRINFLETIQKRDRLYYLLNDEIENRARQNISASLEKLKA